jgi:hypothetical protein
MLASGPSKNLPKGRNIPAMNTTTSRSRFLLLPELSEPSVTAKQPVLRRYSLSRLPASRADPLPERRHTAKRRQP